LHSFSTFRCQCHSAYVYKKDRPLSQFLDQLISIITTTAAAAAAAADGNISRDNMTTDGQLGERM